MIVFFQAEDGIRDYKVTGVQTCALPILAAPNLPDFPVPAGHSEMSWLRELTWRGAAHRYPDDHPCRDEAAARITQIGRASCRGRGEIGEGAEAARAAAGGRGGACTQTGLSEHWQ